MDKIEILNDNVKIESTLTFEESVGYQIRLTHRLIQKLLQSRLEVYGVNLGMWYFLRALWRQDGLTQKQLSDQVGTMEPTTMSAIAAMEKAGFVYRERNSDDKRKINIFLTENGSELQEKLLPIAKDVVEISKRNLSNREVTILLDILKQVQENITTTLNN